MSEMDAAASTPDSPVTPDARMPDVASEMSAEAAARADALKGEGNALLASSKYSLAAEKYTEALEISPTSAIIYSNRAMVYIKMESYGLAIADAEEAIAIDPAYIKAYYRRGSANYALGKYKIAQRDFREVCKRKPQDKDARAKLKECEKQVKEALFAAAIVADDPTPYSASLDPSTISVEDGYDGPRFDDGAITFEFVTEAMERFKEQKLIHRK